MPKKNPKRTIVRIKRKRTIRLSTFSKLVKSDLVRLEEDRIIDDAITILENKLVNLNLPNLNDILSLKNEFLYNSNQLLQTSKHMVNFIVYFVSSTRDKFNKCGNRYSIAMVPQNFDELLKLLFRSDCIKDKKIEIKNDLIKLSELINDYEVQIALNKMNREKLKSVNVNVDDLNVHSSDLLQFKSLALELDKLVFDYYQLRYKSFKFRSHVMLSITKRYINDLKMLLEEFNDSIVLLKDNQELNGLLQRSKKKMAELDKKKSKNEDYSELEKEIKLLLQEIDDKEKKSDRMTKERDDSSQEKLDQNAVSLLDKSEEFREITKSIILQFKLSREIKQHLVKMCKLIDTRFKLKYPNLNESKYFLHEIDDILISEIILALDHFAKERQAQERIEQKKQDKIIEEKLVNLENRINKLTKTKETDDKLKDEKDVKNDETSDEKKDDKKEEIRNDDDEKSDDKSIKDKEEVKLDESTCANVKVR